MNATTVSVVQYDLDPFHPRALKILLGDNEIAHLSMKNDRLMSELLKEVKEGDVNGLIGTGYDEMMLANLVFTTRNKSEIDDFDAAAEWAGMPDYSDGVDDIVVHMHFRSLADKLAFGEMIGIKFTDKTNSSYWPVKEKEDTSSLKFTS
jgi:hypothetical protein